MYNFPDPNLVTFYLCIYPINPLQQIGHLKMNRHIQI